MQVKRMTTFILSHFLSLILILIFALALVVYIYF